MTKPKAPDQRLSPQQRSEINRRNGSARWANDNGHHSETMKVHWTDPEYRTKMEASLRTPERREQSRQGALKRWNAMTPEQQQAEMGRLHSTVKGGHHMSALEAQVVMVLNELGLWYKLYVLAGKYVADILVQGSPMIDIECDGAYWHQDKPSDNARDLWFIENGYNVIRVTDDDVDKLKERLS